MQHTDAHKPVILTVDDEANILKALKRTLRKVDAKIIAAESGQEALDLLDTERVDVVISDMRMPGMSGAELLARVRADQPQCSRILLTGYSDVADTIQAVNEGGIARYLSKPWDDDELRQVVEDAIRLVRLEHENKRLHQTLASHNQALEQEVAARTEALERSNFLLQKAVDDLADSYETMVDLLANLGTMPNPEPITTGKKVDLALAMAEALGMDEEQKQTLKHAVRLHRLGWNALPEKLKSQAYLQMTSSQRQQFEQHPVYAEALLMSVPKLRAVGKLLRAQHERHDGTGFPDRARTSGIAQSAQILAIARDYYDYQRGRISDEEMSEGNAADAIRADAGHAYHPDLVKVFETALPKVEKVAASLAEVRIDARSLQAGMVLSRDLTTSQGAMLLNKGAVLNETVIATIINLEQRSDKTLSVYVRLSEGTPK